MFSSPFGEWLLSTQIWMPNIPMPEFSSPFGEWLLSTLCLRAQYLCGLQPSFAAQNLFLSNHRQISTENPRKPSIYAVRRKM